MRDDFSRRTIETIARRVNYRCSNPDCRRQTAGPSAEPDRAVIVGEAAHITAASPDGKRYDVGLTPDQRQHPDNGIWLCAVCHTLIDNDPARYTADLLRQWKAQAEQSALVEIEQREPFWDRLARSLTRDTEAARALRNRQTMLKLVHNTWVKGVLEQSLHGAAMIELGMEERVDAVERPWDAVVQMPGELRRQLPRGVRIVDVFDEMNQALLILGEPGSGKTTMLLELARDTITRAEGDPTQPIPVVFNLSSWAEKEQPIAEWLVKELNSKYYISKKIARVWVEDDELLLLLDGLDEVEAEIGDSCIQALNAFRLEHQMPIVVCSRIAVYEARTTKLNLHGAMLLQPLTSEQIDEYLNDTDVELLAVRRTLEHDSTLQELAQVPLILSVMTLAYRAMSIEDLGSLDSLDMRRQHLFAAYVRRMFERRGIDQPYTPKQTVFRLAWLAQNMLRHGHTIFLIEWMQPSWLQKHGLYTVALGGIGCLIGALIGGGGFGLPGAIAGAILNGVVGLFLSDELIEPVERLKWSWIEFRKHICSLPSAWLGFATVMMDEEVGCYFPLLWLVLGGLFLYSGSGIFKAIILGLVWVGIGFLLLPTLTTLLYGLTGSLKALRYETVQVKMAPNEGIRRSARNCLILSLTFGPIIGVAFGLTSLFFFGPQVGWSLGLFFFFLIGTIYGGSAVLQHLALRFALFLEGYVPWRYARFLDYAADRIFLRKVGGGYIFVHRMLQEYFASLYTPEAGKG